MIVPAEKYQAGKLLSVTFGEGIVTSLPVSEGGNAGIANEAFADEMLHCEDGPDGGIWAQYENVPFELSVSETNPLTVVLAEWESAVFTVESANVVHGIEPDSIQAKYTLDGNGFTSERSAVCNYSLSGEGKLINVGLPVEPLENEVFEFTIPAGKVYDVYGNVNANEVSNAPADCVKPLSFGIAINASSNLVEFSLAPSTPNKYYYYELLPSKDVEGVSDEEYIASVKNYIAGWAEEDGVDFQEEYIEFFANKREVKDAEYNLEQKTGYTLLAFYMSADGSETSKVFRMSITTVEFVKPAEITGTLTYNNNFLAPLGTKPGMEVAYDAENDKWTLKGFGPAAADLSFSMDESGNVVVPEQLLFVHSQVGNIYIVEAQGYNQDYTYQSYYDTRDKTIYFHTVIYYAGGMLALSEGDDTFCFDGSVAPAPEPSPARASVSAGKQLFVPGSLGIAPMEIDAKCMRRHRSR